MQHSPDSSSASSRPGYLAEVTLAMIHIRNSAASGRLSIRNGEQFGIAHLYFKQAHLVHVTGDKRDGEIVLQDLLSWSKGNIRFDAAITIEYEDVTWQQAQIFARWLSFLEMRALLLGIPQSRLNGLVHSLTASLPGQPLALPQEVTNYEVYSETAGVRQWQRISEGVNQVVDRAISKEQLQHVSHSAVQHINTFMHQTSQVTQRFVKVLQEKTLHTAQTTQPTINRAKDHVDESIQHTQTKEPTQRLIQSAPNTVQSIDQNISYIDAHTANPIATAKPRVRSVRPVPTPFSATSELDDE